MVRYIRLQTASIALLTAFVLAAVPAGAAEIELRAEATPPSTIVRLGDVAEVRSADTAEARRLAELPLMAVPAPGTERFLRLREVRDLLAARGEPLSVHTFGGESAVRIKSREASSLPRASSARELRQTAWKTGAAVAGEKKEHGLSAARRAELNDLVRRAVENYLVQCSGKEGNWRVALDVPEKPLAMLAEAASGLECNGGKAPWVGQQRFVISFSNTRGGISQFSVLANVTRPQSVVVAVGPIEQGRLLTAADVRLAEWENPPTGNGRDLPFDSVETLIGQEATRSIRAGELIMTSDVRPPLLVRRGQEITVVARGGGIQVRTTARARQDGARGDLVRVESLATREPFDAVVVGPKEAVVFSGSAAPVAETADRSFRTPRR